MPFYPLTEFHSHRHPFLGPDDMIDPSTELAPGVYEALAGDEGVQYKRPLIRGATAGLLTYLTARVFDVDAKKSLRVAVTIAGINALFGIASDLLWKEMEDIKAAEPAVKKEG